MKTVKMCGDCPLFKPVPEERRSHGINGDGWCDFRPPANMTSLMFGKSNPSINRDRVACSIMIGKRVKL